jgi:nucleotide-binding universal stress UspA family protein
VYQKILVPTDGSRWSDRAAAHAADLARRYNASVTVLMASDLQSLVSSFLPKLVQQEMRRAAIEADEAALARTAGIFGDGDVPVTTKRLEGSPAFVIAAEAAEGKYDLIVMGSRGLGQQDQETDLLGSVTDRVLHRVFCPVLVVKR